MDRIAITGGARLEGEIPISGAKNSAIKLMAASLLTDQPLRLTNMPRLADTRFLGRLLERLGVRVIELDGPTGPETILHAPEITSALAPTTSSARCALASTCWARCSPARAREGQRCPAAAPSALAPSTCTLKALEALGARIDLSEGYVFATAPRGLQGAHVAVPVRLRRRDGACAARCGAGRGRDGALQRRLRAGDRRPRRLLERHGREGRGAGTPTITITGVSKLKGATHAVIPDRIETGAYAMAAAMAGGEVRLTGTRSDFLGGLLEKLNEAGAEARATNDGVEIKRNGARLKGVDLTTEVYPGFATDMQAPFMALMTMAEGDSIIRETIFENRFMHAPELMRLGADISLSGGEARVHGVEQLRGAPVMATDLRASVSLVIAGWRRRARRWSTASTTSTAASSGSRRSSAAAAPRSAGLKRRRLLRMSLRLLAEDAGDLQVISAALQDAVAKLGDVRFDPALAP
jgi:UDP-N-acetylglucosamine 1-carboxyvinyltransferase